MFCFETFIRNGNKRLNTFTADNLVTIIFGRYLTNSIKGMMSTDDIYQLFRTRVELTFHYQSLVRSLAQFQCFRPF